MSKTNTDTLAGVLANDLNKQFKDNDKVAFFLDDAKGSPTDVVDFVSTGSSILDLIISNRKNGGLPYGKIVEFQGLEASGKSLICSHVIAEVQKQDGIGIYIDTESAASQEFLTAIGVDNSQMLYLSFDTVEDIFSSIEALVTRIRSSDRDRKVVIVVDSISAASSKVEMEADFDQAGWATAKAIIISKAMRKLTQMIAKQKICLIFTSQLRINLGVSFGDKYITSGGKALGFHASVIVRLTKSLKIKNPKGDIIGIQAKAKIHKNRIGPPLRETTILIYFDRGIDDINGWLQFLKIRKLVKSGGSWYTITHPTTKEDIKFQAKDWENKLKDPVLKSHVYDIICDDLILTYKKREDRNLDNINVVDE
jgi:recombination protein RecA